MQESSHKGNDLAGARVTVMGLGLFGGGVAAARWAHAHGAQVCVTDLRDAETLAPSLEALANVPVQVVLGGHRDQDFQDADIVVANPAVPPNNRYLQLARDAGTSITSEFEWALDALPGRVVLITGTQGKSSTTHFLGQLLRATDAPGSRTHVGGNLGRSLLDAIDEIGPHDTSVLEVSSYQLDALRPGAREHIVLVAITNVLADHLERHADLASYAAAKARVLDLVREGGAALLPSSFKGNRTFATRDDVCVLPFGPGTSRTRIDGRFVADEVDLGAVDHLTVPGAFQWDNLGLALSCAHALGREPDALAATITNLTGLPHRLEALDAVNGCLVLDNGVSTTPDSTLAALDSVPAPCTLLVGGRPKQGLTFADLAVAAATRGDRVIAFGEAADRIARTCASFGAYVVTASSFSEAVPIALERTPAGQTLLFSPACSSFDSHANFRARAVDFRALLDQHAMPRA
jgi:UDP-N-acetylmuramoylalanine--D-glutamate ligase